MDAPSPAPVRRDRSGPILIGVALCAIVLLVLHARLYLPFIADDALISLRYAQRLLHGQGLTWSAGRPVEGYSNLLWVLLCAAGGISGADLIDVARTLGLFCSGLAICAIVAAARRYAPRSALPAIAGALALALSGSVASWSIGGLEQPLLAVLLGWALVLLYPLLDAERPLPRPLLGVGLLFGLLVLTRPDAPIFVAGAVLGLLLARRFDRVAWISATGISAVALLFWFGQLIFRLSYYGEWVPNTALVKLGISAHHLAGGANYVLKWGLSVLPLLLLTLAGIFSGALDHRGRRRLSLLAPPLLLWLLYVLGIGGDIFPGRRHMVVATLLLALATVEALASLRRRSRGAAVIATAVALVLFGWMQWNDPANVAAREERWEWDGAVIGKLLKHAFARRQPTIAVAAAGCIPYWSELPAIDMLGLNDYYIPRHPPADVGQGKIGHELGDGRYVLSRSPDLVMLCDYVGGDTACFVGERQLLALPEFRWRYTLVTFEGRDPSLFRARIWAWRESPRIGIERGEGSLAIPGWLLAEKTGTVARLDDRGRIGCVVSREASGEIDSIVLPAGRWRLAAESSAPVRLIAQPSGDPAAPPKLLSDGELLMLDRPSTLDLRVAPLEGTEAHLRSIRFTREP